MCYNIIQTPGCLRILSIFDRFRYDARRLRNTVYPVLFNPGENKKKKGFVKIPGEKFQGQRLSSLREYIIYS